jgi:RNase P/RNase MRP subunit p30
MFMNRKTQICQMSDLSNLIYKFNALSIKIPASYFLDIENWILKSICGIKRLKTANIILKEKNKIRRLTLTNLNTYIRAMIIKTV